MTRIVSAGQTSSGLVIVPGDPLIVTQGGSVLATTVSAGGSATIFGADSATTISSGGSMVVSSGGITTGDLVGGTETVVGGGQVTGATLGSSGRMTLTGTTSTTYDFATGSFTTTVVAAAVATGTVVNGGYVDVAAGGLTSGMVLSGFTGSLGFPYTALEDLDGGSAIGTVIGSGARVDFGSGTLSATTLLAGGAIDLTALRPVSNGSVGFDRTAGILTVTEGAVTSSFTLAGSYDGTFFVAAPDNISGTIVSLASGVAPGQSSSGVVVSSGVTVTVANGGSLLAATILSAGSATVYGTESGATVNSGGNVTVSSGGSATGDYVLGTESVSGGGVVSATLLTGHAILGVYGTTSLTLSNGGFVYAVVASGLAKAAVASGGGSIYVNIGGITSGAIILTSGSEGLFGGRSVATVLSGNAQQFFGSAVEYVGSGGVADSTLVGSGGQLTLAAGGISLGAVVSNGGMQLVSSGGAASRAVIGTGGVLTVSAGGSATNTTLHAGATIDLASVSFASGAAATINNTTDVLTVTAGTTTYTQQLAGNYAGDTFRVSRDAFGGTNVTVSAPPSDFNGDGRSDLVLQNNDGTIAIQQQVNLAATSLVTLGNPGPSWHVMGSGDFNGDGQPDLLLQNDNGTVVDYLMNGTAITAGVVVGNPGASWHVRGSGDFNGDGTSDVLLQNDSGAMVVWNLANGAYASGSVLGTLPAGWAVEGVADFNGDGMADVLVQNAATSTLVVYTTSGGAITGGGALGTPGAGWAATGTGDYNGDGRADVLLHNDNGADVIWEANGSTLAGAVYLGNPGANYAGAVAGVDLNGDGSTDLVVQNNVDGSLVGYTLNNTAQITAGALLSTPGAAWHAVGDVPVFIQNGSPAGTLTGTAGADQFNETTPGAGLHQVAGFDAALDVVALSVAQFGSFAAVQAAALPYQGGTFIGFDNQTALVIQGVTPDKLTAANFVLR